jgi:REP element-mobilizing transposase RayT
MPPNRENRKVIRGAGKPSPSLPLRDEHGQPSSQRTHTRIVIAHHLVLHGYGQWLPNDPRGSGSDELRQDKLAELGPIHIGRKRVQPARSELRQFYREAEPLLDYASVWIDDAKRQAIGEAFAQVAAARRYTVWACAVLCNHAHLCTRRHRDDALTMWNQFANNSRRTLRRLGLVAIDHPVWSTRPYKVFLYSPEDVRRVTTYINTNPAKEHLTPQVWPFVREYDGWPHTR